MLNLFGSFASRSQLTLHPNNSHWVLLTGLKFTSLLLSYLLFQGFSIQCFLDHTASWTVQSAFKTFISSKHNLIHSTFWYICSNSSKPCSIFRVFLYLLGYKKDDLKCFSVLLEIKQTLFL